MLAKKTLTKDNSVAPVKAGNKKSEPEEAAPQIQLNPYWNSLATHVGGRLAAGTSGDPSPIQRKLSRPTSALHIQRMGAESEEELNADAEMQVQTKLTVGAPDDPYEKEADAVADKVMRMPVGGNQGQLQEDAPSIQSKSLKIPSVQRLCAECTEELSGGGTPSVQRKSNGTSAQPSVPYSVSSTINSPSSGSPLNDAVRSRVEPVLGADLSNVRVHSDASAQNASQSLKAKAFTHQNNIYLGSGQSAADTELLAHEATHVVQQGAGMPSARIQRRIVMRTITPQMRNFGWFGNVPVGTTENLRTLTNEEVESYINDIGTVHHDYDDIISGTGEEFDFVSNESYRRGLIISIIRNLHSVRTNLYFDSYREAVQEVRKRALISLFMRASQGRTRGSRPTGYPRSCGSDPGPRVSQAAGSYWIVHPGSGSVSYWFQLSSNGRTNAYEALRTLIFNHQNSSCLRTLMHCDYMVSAQQFFVMADAMGAADFNQAVANGNINLEIRWNSYENIVADTPTSSGQYQSLQSVNLSSENELIIGDHVLFYNHDAFDDMNEVHYNVRGNYSNWRLENAIVTDMDSSGEFRFQGHGYFTPKRRSAFVRAMVGKMNSLVGSAQTAIAAGETNKLGFGSGGNRFEVVRSVGQRWNIHYHEGLGTGAAQSVLTMPLRRFTAADYPSPFVAPGGSSIQVRRPIESRRESIGSSSMQPSSTGGASPLPRPRVTPIPPPPTTAPAPKTPTPMPPPVPTTPSPGSETGGSVAVPRPTGSQQQQQQQRRQQPQSQQPPQQPTSPPSSPCTFTCSGRHLLGARPPHYGRGDDFKAFDFPSLSTSQWLRVAPFRLMPDSLLEFGMNNTLGLLAGADGRAMVSHFRGGTGRRWTHGIGSSLNRDATHCPSINSAVSSVKTQLAAQMRTMRSLGKVNCSAFSLSPVPVFHFGFADSVALKAIIGGTQGLEVYLNGIRPHDPAACNYKLDLQFSVLDDFGVDTSDLYWPALIKFWILQHERRGNRPFVNRLLVNRTIIV